MVYDWEGKRARRVKVLWWTAAAILLGSIAADVAVESIAAEDAKDVPSMIENGL